MTVYGTFAQLLREIDTLNNQAASILETCAPVPFFGDIESSRAATVGINPSNREFVDAAGSELDGHERRFHTTSSLGLRSWSEATGSDLYRIGVACIRYFRIRPYDTWFRVLEQVLAPSGLSYYGQHPSACHLDLVPYATAEKWGALRTSEQRLLLKSTARSFAETVRDSKIELLILNGQTVVNCFEGQCGVSLARMNRADWNLGPAASPRVAGYGYAGEISSLSGVSLNRTVRVVGYNHNLQSSFGVTGQAKSAIGRWIKDTIGR